MDSTGAPPRVLLLQPDVSEAGLLACALEGHGFATRRVDTAEAALDACVSEPPDLVVLAARHDVAPRLRMVGARRSVAILLVADASALEAGSVSSGPGAGADDFLVRPVRGSELVARCAALLRLKAARDELRDRVHNLKNPLSAILVNCQFLMRHSNMDDQVREVVGEITESACALSRKLSGGGQATAQTCSTTEVTP